ncbi:MAG: hypothetical protein Q4G33_03960 [bacterium]|nr:hypothetical protein [bacterium]
MADNKFYTVTKEIKGKKYVAQFNGLSYVLKLTDDTYISDTSSNHSNVKMSEKLFNDVIVEPKGLTPDSFDDMDEYNEVTNFAMDVAKGKFRDKQDTGEEKSKG